MDVVINENQTVWSPILIKSIYYHFRLFSRSDKGDSNEVRLLSEVGEGGDVGGDYNDDDDSFLRVEIVKKKTLRDVTEMQKLWSLLFSSCKSNNLNPWTTYFCKF